MYAFSAVKAAFKFALASLCLERAWNLMKLGMAMAARMPMIATTIISSMRVKPLARVFMKQSNQAVQGRLNPSAPPLSPHSPHDRARRQAGQREPGDPKASRQSDP